MNLLVEALPYLQGLISNQDITIINKKQVNDNGFVSQQDDIIKTFAHIQAMNPSELVKLTQGTLDSPSMYKFYITQDLAMVLNSLNNIDTIIEWGLRKFSIFQKTDQSLNGWIMVIGSEKNV